jgi:hypothetical protein
MWDPMVFEARVQVDHVDTVPWTLLTCQVQPELATVPSPQSSTRDLQLDVHGSQVSPSVQSPVMEHARFAPSPDISVSVCCSLDVAQAKAINRSLAARSQVTTPIPSAQADAVG